MAKARKRLSPGIARLINSPDPKAREQLIRWLIEEMEAGREDTVAAEQTIVNINPAGSYLPLSGGTLTGNLTVPSNGLTIGATGLHGTGGGGVVGVNSSGWSNIAGSPSTVQAALAAVETALGSLAGGSYAVQSLAPSGTTQTIDWSNGNVVLLDLSSATGTVDLTLTNPEEGREDYVIVALQGGTPRDLTFSANQTVYLEGSFSPGDPVGLSASANQRHILRLTCTDDAATDVYYGWVHGALTQINQTYVDPSSLGVWFDGDDATVSSWPDSTGTYDLVQATPANQPSTTTLNGNNALSFNGTSDYLQGAVAGSYNCFAVVFRPTNAITSASTKEAVVSFTNNGTLVSLGATTGSFSGEVVTIFDGTWRKASANNLSAATTYIYMFRFATPHYEIYQDGGSDIRTLSANTAAAISPGDLIIGRDRTGGDYFDGVVAAVVLGNDWTNLDMNNLGNDLATRYGPSWSTIT